MPARTLLLALACLILVVATAHAEELKKPTDPEALKHYEAGKAEFKDKHFQAAADEFQRSIALEASPAAYYNGGVCYRTIATMIDLDPTDKRGHFELAIVHYERFLKTTKNTPEYTALVNKLVAETRAAIDGLPKVEPVASAPISTTTVPSTTEPPTPTTPPEMPAQPAGGRSRLNDPVGWVVTSAGVVGLGAAGLLFWNASSLRDEASHTSTQSERNELRDRADRRSLSGTIIGVGSGLVLIVGIVKLAIADTAPSGKAMASAGRRTDTWPTVSVALSPSGLSVSGQF